MTRLCRHIALGFAGISIATTFEFAGASAAHAVSLIDGATAAAAFAGNSVASGYRAAPALMLGIAILAAIPFLALGARLFERMRQADEVTRRYHSGAPENVDVVGEAAAVPGHAFVEVIGTQNGRYAILRDMLRIGREDDNDIRIPSRGVHRYHAAIHREDFADWWITDLSGTDGNGLVVNGQRCSDALLHDGDVIQLGPGRLKFHAGFA